LRHQASAASSSTKVPVTLVSTKAAAPSMERSTWLSAARCMITSGATSAITSAMRRASVMSSRKKR
jgi:hypothetical protein